jgi:hypothetical protein
VRLTPRTLGGCKSAPLKNSVCYERQADERSDTISHIRLWASKSRCVQELDHKLEPVSRSALQCSIMLTWPVILIGSVLIGVSCALVSTRRLALVAAAVLPWLTLLAVLLYYEYFAPYQGDGASLWPIAQLIGGTIAAGVGLGSATIARRMRRSARGQ